MFINIHQNIKHHNNHVYKYTARTARFSKKSLGSDVGEMKKMSEKLKKNNANIKNQLINYY